MSFTKPCIYLDNSATSRFKPRGVITAVKRELKRSANPGRGGHRPALLAGEKIESVRSALSDFTKKPNVVFTKNCTEALNLAILGSHPKGEIITTVYEHNSVLRPLEHLRSEGVKITYLHSKDRIITPELLRQKMSHNVSLAVISEMNNVTGDVQNISALGSVFREYGIPFIVDTAQSMGHVNPDYRNADFICSAGHKGLHGPQGTGFLSFDSSLRLLPILYGGTGTESESLRQPTTAPEGYESGTLNTPSIAGLGEGLKWTSARLGDIRKKIQALSAYLREELKKLDGLILYTQNDNGVISINYKDYSSTELADLLDEKYGIATRAGLHCAPLLHKSLGTLKRGTVRMSLGVNNSYDDVEAVISALKNL